MYLLKYLFKPMNGLSSPWIESNNMLLLRYLISKASINIETNIYQLMLQV